MSERHLLIYFPARLIPGLVNFAALALYTRWLSAEEYGRYSLVLAVVSFVQVVAFYWLRLGLLRFFQQSLQSEQFGPLLTTAATGFLLVAVATSAVWALLVGMLPINTALQTALWYGLPLLLIQSLYEMLLEANQAALAPGRYALLSGGRALLALAFAALGIWLIGESEQAVLLGLTFGAALMTFIELPRWVRQMVPLRFDSGIAANFFRYGAPLAMNFALIFVVASSDRLMLQFLLASEAAVGLYAVAYDLASQPLTLICMVVNLALYPLVIRDLDTKGPGAASQRLHYYATMFFALGLPASVGLAMVARPLSAVLLGASFAAAAAELLPWIAGATLLACTKAFYFDLAYQLGLKTEWQILSVAVAAVLNVVLNLLWIPAFGLIGAAYATVVAYAVGLAISALVGRRVFALPLPIDQLMRISGSTFVMAGLIWLISRGNWTEVQLLILQIAVGIVSYVGMAWVFNIAQLRDKSRGFLKQVRLGHITDP